MKCEPIFRKVNNNWQRKFPGENVWQQLRVIKDVVIQTKNVTKKADGKEYVYTFDVEKETIEWVWEPINDV